MPLDLSDNSQHWFRWWLGAVRQQAITWANVDPGLCRQMASLGLNELNHLYWTRSLSHRGLYWLIVVEWQDAFWHMPHRIWSLLIEAEWDIYASIYHAKISYDKTSLYFQYKANIWSNDRFTLFWLVWSGFIGISFEISRFYSTNAFQTTNCKMASMLLFSTLIALKIHSRLPSKCFRYIHHHFIFMTKHWWLSINHRNTCV